MTSESHPRPPGADDRPPDRTAPRDAGAPSHASSDFEQLYESLAPALHAWASLRISPSHRGRLDPEDIVQEAWWRAIGAFASFDPAKGTFRAWIFQIANRVLLNGFRRLYVRGQLRDDARPRQVSVPDHVAAEATSISERASRNESAQRLLLQAEQLDAEERTLFSYCALEGMTAADAAQLLGISEAAAAKRWQRLRTKLRDAFDNPILEP